MSYLLFHILFVVPPVLLLARACWRRPASLGWRGALGLGLMALVALLYTAPWDAHLIRQGVWRYGEGRVLGTVGPVPIEEYLFFLLQTLLSGLWLYALLGRGYGVGSGSGYEDAAGGKHSGARWAGALLWLAVGLAGAPMLRTEHWCYLGLILVWASPVLALQWAYGGPLLRRAGRLVFLGAAAPTAYLWVADRVAIAAGIWSLSPRYTTGISPFGLPLEEMVFFALTNLMVIQGLLLFLWVTARLRGQTAGSAARGRAAAAPAPGRGEVRAAGGPGSASPDPARTETVKARGGVG